MTPAQRIEDVYVQAQAEGVVAALDGLALSDNPHQAPYVNEPNLPPHLNALALVIRTRARERWDYGYKTSAETLLDIL
jgi:hypothetical protein